MEEIKKSIEIVKNDILERFPNCPHTIRVLLWDDGTSSVECRHGKDNTIHVSQFYNGLLTYQKYEFRGRGGVLIDEYGTEYYPRS